MEYGEIKTRLIFNRLMARLEKGQTLSDAEMKFVEANLSKYRKNWTGFRFYNGLKKLQEVAKNTDIDEKS